MATAREESNRLLLRARDAIDRSWRDDLDVPALAAIACMSEAHFTRSFKRTFGETPHRYLQRRRIERAMELLRTTGRDVTEICMTVGFSSLGTFSRTFTTITGTTPSAYRQKTRDPGLGQVPSCFVKEWTRPTSAGDRPARSGAERLSSFGEGGRAEVP